MPVGKSPSRTSDAASLAVAKPVAYRPVFSDEAADFLVQQPRRRQRKILRLAQILAGSPFVRSDYVLTDETGRSIEYLLIEDYVFAYWLDHAERELRIIDIEDAS